MTQKSVHWDVAYMSDYHWASKINYETSYSCWSLIGQGSWPAPIMSLKVQIDTEWSKSYFIWISTENDLAVAITASKVCTVVVQQIQWMRWNSNVQFPHNRVTKKWKALLNWNGRDIMSRHAVIPFAPSWAYFTYYSLPDVIFSFLFKVRRIEHLRMVMHRKIKTHRSSNSSRFNQ